MRIILGSAGTRSDLAFFFKLGKRLQDRNHTVTMIVPEKYRSEIMKMELRMVTCGRNFDEYLEGNSEDTSSEFVKALASQIASQFVALRDALREADVLVSDIFLIPAASMAEKVGIPYFQLIQSPLLLEPAAFPFVGISDERVSGILGKRRKESLRKEWQEIIGSVLNHEREFSHLKAVDDLYKHLMSAGRHLIAVDPEISNTRQSQNQTVVGYYNADAIPSSSDKPSIFLGKLPIPILERQSFLSSVCETLDASGYRVVVPSDWYDSNEKCAVINPAQMFDSILQSAAVVHQGSAGIAMTCAKAGIPQIVVPYLIENLFWAERVDSLKLGLDMKKGSDAKSIAAAVLEAIQMKESVAAISGKLRNRDALELACEAIENLITAE
jgi:UDP:flavonoid glycosyltransferase YjiC (YdhE family)